MFKSRLSGLTTLALIAALVCGVGAMVQAQDANETNASEEEGQIVQIGPDLERDNAQNDRGNQQRAFQPGFADPGPFEPSPYWIGLMGGPVSPELRHHVDLPENQGLLVLEVVPNSPAAEAGLEKYDILLRAGDIELDEMQDLVELVRSEGEKQGQIAIEVLRHGQRETIWVTPAERPSRFEGAPLGPPRGFSPEFPQGFRFRNFGPGVVMGGQQFGLAQLPNGVSVQVEKQGDAPARITVEQDGQRWEIEGNDQEALAQLPDDLRPFVEQMLRGGQTFKLPSGEELDRQMPQLRRMMPRLGQDDELKERLDEMERQMRELEERLLSPEEDAAQQ